MSSISYNFPSTGLLHPLLYSSLGMLYIFKTTVNGIVFLVSLSTNLLLVYENATDFWILIMYPDILLNSFISPNCSW